MQNPTKKQSTRLFPATSLIMRFSVYLGEKDSVWLECTSKTADFGVLGSFTENRNALLITENGGVLVPTPMSRASENVIRAYTTVDLKDDGSGKTNTVFCGKW